MFYTKRKSHIATKSMFLEVMEARDTRQLVT